MERVFKLTHAFYLYYHVKFSKTPPVENLFKTTNFCRKAVQKHAGFEQKKF